MNMQPQQPQLPTLSGPLGVAFSTAGSIFGAWFRWRRWLSSLQVQQAEWNVDPNSSEFGRAFAWMSPPAILSQPSIMVVAGVTMCLYETVIFPRIKVALMRLLGLRNKGDADAAALRQETEQFEQKHFHEVTSASAKQALAGVMNFRSAISGVLIGVTERAGLLPGFGNFVFNLASRAVMYPLYLVFTQALFLNLRHATPEYLNIFSHPRKAIEFILKEEGWKGLYHGFSPVIIYEIVNFLSGQIINDFCVRPLLNLALADVNRVAIKLSSQNQVKRPDIFGIPYLLQHLFRNGTVAKEFALRCAVMWVAMLSSAATSSVGTWLSVSHRIAENPTGPYLWPTGWDLVRTLIASVISSDFAIQ